MTRWSALLMVGLVVSGLYLVKTSYEARRLFSDIEKARADERQLLADEKRLDAERQAQATHLRVERVAREKLGMRMATADVIRYVSDDDAPAASRAAQ